jgi:hypothetical protein
MALISARIGSRTGEPGQASDRLTWRSRLARASSPAVRPLTSWSGDINLASSDGSPDVLHTDAVPEGHTTETRSLVRRATVTFERVRRDALPCAQSRDLIMEVANEQWKQ